MPLPVTLRRVSAVPALAEVVVCEFSGGGGRHRGGAAVGGVGSAVAGESAGGLTAGAAWRGRRWGLANVSSDVWVVVAFTVDAYELTGAVVEGLTWATAGGYSQCKEWEVENVAEQNTQRC